MNEEGKWTYSNDKNVNKWNRYGEEIGTRKGRVTRRIYLSKRIGYSSSNVKMITWYASCCTKSNDLFDKRYNAPGSMIHQWSPYTTTLLIRQSNRVTVVRDDMRLSFHIKGNSNAISKTSKITLNYLSLYVRRDGTTFMMYPTKGKAPKWWTQIYCHATVSVSTCYPKLQ